jgi:hypothetical protein
MEVIRSQPTAELHMVTKRVPRTGSQPADFMEHRWGRRMPCVAKVCVSAGSAVTGTARLANVSISGAFVETALPLPLFGQVAIAALRADGSTHCVEFTATVVRIDNGGVGIEWNETFAGPICRLLGCDGDCAASRGQRG